jgi:hypothetical protein
LKSTPGQNDPINSFHLFQIRRGAINRSNIWTPRERLGGMLNYSDRDAA